MQIAIYSRKSKFTGKGESIENQISLCRRYIDAHYSGASVSVYEDEGFSGKNTDRPEFLAMMAAARRGELSAIVCYRLDRISRNIGDFAKLIEELSGLNTDFVSIKEQFDTASPLGRAMMYIASVFSQLERETIAERIRDNMMELAKTGRWLGGKTPLGYRSEAIDRLDDGRVRRAYRLAPVAEELELVRLIHRKFLQLHSLTQVETYLLQNGASTREGVPFSRYAIKRILQNPVYCCCDDEARRYFNRVGAKIYGDFDGGHGLMAYNKTRQRSNRSVAMRERRDWIVAPGSHEGVVSGKDFARIQDLLERNKAHGYPSTRSGRALLPGLLFCTCGQPMRAKLTGRMKENRAFIYLCQGKEKCKSCALPSPRGGELDEKVAALLDGILEDRAHLFARLLEGKAQLSGDSERSLLEKRLRDVERRLEGLVGSLGRLEEPAARRVLEEIERLERERLAAEERLARWTAPPIEETYKKLTSWRALFEELGLMEKRELLRRFVLRIVWDGQDGHLFLKPAREHSQ
ncbi:recombinase family protein [Gehongia tenuis]|uniref:Recombinase family protein n=1 Tax=Gehongia tenuis TaxID=2763655 RepID=A0A926D4E6_9FIRM|nr:recombinase family protein [Gehongia tenuis]MBC8531148.1 recombinase family protein [Gehongia tenuis]